MDRFSALAAFTTVAELGSFSAAARRLGRSTTAVSRAIAALEGELGARLLNRTTRRVSLADVGAGYLEVARRILADLEERAPCRRACRRRAGRSPSPLPSRSGSAT